jgi:hypothetical protein
MSTYPRGEISLNQARRMIEGKEPHIAYRSWDGLVNWHLMGPLAPIPGVQDGVTIGADSIKGLIGTWQMLDQTGANQDGTTFVDAVYSPVEVDMQVEAHGVTEQSTRQVIRDWIASWDAHRTGELSVFTPEYGLWWGDVRWLKAPTDTMMAAHAKRQPFLWTARVDEGFWQSFDSVGTFNFGYETMTDTFKRGTTSSTNLGANWPIAYFGPGTGDLYAYDGQARWRDQVASLSLPLVLLTGSREAVAGPYKDFTTATNNQVVSIVMGTMPELALPLGAFNDLWARMGRNVDGTWNGHGIRARIGWGSCEIARYNGFDGSGNPIKTVMAARPLLLPPLVGDKFTLIAGFEGNERLFKIVRNGVDMLVHKERGTGSSIGSSYRGIGFGMFAAGALFAQATPGNVRKISAGDNATVTQEGFLQLTNIGDVKAHPRYLVYGPGTFSIGNGPDSEDMVEIGPLVEGQVILLETEPRRRSVVDVSPSQLPEQVLNPLQQIIRALVTFASNNNVPPLLRQFENLFGILPPQVNLYSLMRGRFTAAIEPRPSNSAGTTSNIKIRIDDGNASSKVVGAVTPRRRWPL